MTLKIWIASFIPKDIAGYTKPVPGGGGKTMIPGPTALSDCFLTDQRSFSISPTASSRTRSSVEIDTVTMTLTSQLHHCGNTVEVDCEDGDVECDQTPDNSKLKVNDFTSSGAKCSFSFAGGAGNPVGIELVLQLKADGITRYAARLLRSNGRYKSADQGDVDTQQFPVTNPTKTNPGFHASIIDAIGAGPGEFWTDVSLLHSPRSLNTSPFDFGWLFSAAGEGEPTALVAAPGLTRMVEAQARIIAVSPPIPIVSH